MIMKHIEKVIKVPNSTKVCGNIFVHIIDVIPDWEESAEDRRENQLKDTKLTRRLSRKNNDKEDKDKDKDKDKGTSKDPDDPLIVSTGNQLARLQLEARSHESEASR